MGVLGELFLTFVKIGLFTFGGGYAMISVIEHICVEDKQWISHDDMMNITVIAESTPGPVAINCATFVGYKKKGIGGAIVATLGMLIPSFTIIFVISMFLDNFLEIGMIANAFKGIKLAVGILIVDAALKMIRKMQKKVYICVILICSTVMMLAINIFSLTFSYLIIMLVAGMISLGLSAGKSRKESES
ncbi:MAG: chromate transporter [Acetatifactor sp.]